MRKCNTCGGERCRYASIWFGIVLRADSSAIRIEAESNIPIILLEQIDPGASVIAYGTRFIAAAQIALMTLVADT